ncbi:F-box protein At1g70590 [Phalaenopsis equestris]|uniref:F-box protein At1g70590 n=1 Tax=Phalaenopsis equestris TaxID=78828 RepID=UPI0009E5FB28|nr:F-box protein At1g70590 [Phalaenopsis equestris]
MVADLHQYGNWNEDLLLQSFGEDLKHRIMAIPCNKNTNEDMMELLASRSGYTITFFTYMAQFEGSVPTNVWLHNYDIGEQTECPWGCMQAEDITHITSNCEIMMVGIMSFFGNWEDTLRALSSSDGEGLAHALIFCNLIHQCWRACNAKKHGKPFGTPTVIAALGAFSFPYRHPIQEQWTPQLSRLSSNSHWCHPSGWLKIFKKNPENPNPSLPAFSVPHQRGRRESANLPFKIPPPPQYSGKFADLPFDVMARIAAAFDIPELWAASTVCRSWREALRPLREAMVLLRWGKRFKHGRGVRSDAKRALESFLKGAERGSAAAMVDAGLMYWEMGRKEEGKSLYARAAELGHPAGQCNLGICFLEADPAEPEEAVKWFFRAAELGNARAQYSLALCLHKGRGVKRNLQEAARWYLRAAEGGNIRAMYNASLCYATGKGFARDLRFSRIWLKRAADCGHRKAQFEHGLELFSSGDTMKALVYVELAVRAGETAASHIRDVIVEALSQPLRDRAMTSVNRWRPQPFNR